MKILNAKGLLALIWWLLPDIATADSLNVQFSADAIQRAPHKNERQARIFAGNNKVRIERFREEQVFVEIYDMENQRTFLLVPQLRSYVEHTVTGGDMTNPMLPSETSDPCTGIPGSVCRPLGSEQVAGRNATRWEMVVSSEDQQQRSLHWVDEERRMRLRDLWSDGSITEMKLLGKEELNGRPSERWEMSTTQPNGTSSKTLQWYDPELGISVREERADGYFRELANIQVAPQPDDLFLVPDGYQKMQLDLPAVNAASGSK